MRTFYVESALSLYDSTGASLHIPASPRTEDFSEFSPAPRKLIKGYLTDLNVIYNPNENIRACKREAGGRLNNFLRLDWGPNSTIIYIVDHHQYALFGWCEAVKEGKIKPGASLRHFDRHCDNRISSLEVICPGCFRSSRWTLNEIVEYITRLHCGDFVEPAQRMGLIGEYIWVKPGNKTRLRYRERVDFMPFSTHHSEVSMGFYKEDVAATDAENKIVDVDLDFFPYHASDSNTDEEVDIKIIREEIASAGVATLATSPGCTNTERAVQLIRRILA